MSVKKKKQVTISMLAEFAGVSRVAVYAAMNPEKKTTVSLSGKTREKILSAAKELGYVPNDMGRTLVSGRSRNVGLLLQSHDSRMSRRLIFACGQRFGRAGYMLIPDTSQNSVEREREILSSFLIKRVDCVIVGWLAYEKNCDLLEQFDRCGIPMIHLQSHSSEYARSATIAFDEAAVMELLCDFLIRRGKKRIGYAGFTDRCSFASADRFEFLRRAVKKHPELTLEPPFYAASAMDCRSHAESLKMLSSRPDALICFNDQLAQVMGVELKFAGLDPLHEITVTGIDGYGDAFDPLLLPSVRLPVEKLAETAFTIFASEDFHQQIIKISPEMVERGEME